MGFFGKYSIYIICSKQKKKNLLQTELNWVCLYVIEHLKSQNQHPTWMDGVHLLFTGKANLTFIFLNVHQLKHYFLCELLLLVKLQK